MEPLDPKAELMRLHDEAAQWVASDEHYSTAYRRENAKQSRAALESAITLALAAERRRALEEAAKLLDTMEDYDGEYSAVIDRICALIDGKAGGT